MTSMRQDAEGRHVLACGAAALRLGAAQTAAAWPVLVARCAFFGLIMTVQAALWDKVAGEQVAGALAAPDGMVLYVAATEWITLALPALHLRLEDDIRGGLLEPYLLRPKPYLLIVFSQVMGGALVRLAALGVTALILLALSGRAAPPAEAFLYLPLLGVMGLVVGVLLYGLAGLCAFWVRRVLPVQLIIQKLMFLMGGLFAPVSLYPDWLQALSEASPFGAHLYWAGVQVLAPSSAGFAIALGWQALWIALLSLACLALWRAGLAKVLREGAA